MPPHNVIAPEEFHTLLEFRQNDLPGFAVVNTALREFEPRSLFSWHLSVLIECDQLVKHRLPSAEEQEILHQFEDGLDPLIKAGSNALFLARVTHDAHREIMWRVHQPDAAEAVLGEILRVKDYPRDLDYRIDSDPGWAKARWYLDGAS